MRRCRLYIAIPAAIPEATLHAALTAGDVAAVLLRAAPDRPPADSLVRAVCARIQRQNIAVVVENHPRLAVSIGADGAHLPADAQALGEARALLGGEATIGVACGLSRHQAMTMGELGADYLAFGGDGDVGGEDVIEMIRWWSGLFELPAVAWIEDAITAARIAAVIAAGADFVAMDGTGWGDATAAAAAVGAVDGLCAAAGQ